mmetsp:Transcript_26650/g.47947  ORF Transcript_26650/g.47947 Transcript_26650/m.47947 type:complete len:178 (+) Transcript_26650:269-802(+)
MSPYPQTYDIYCIDRPKVPISAYPGELCSGNQDCVFGFNCEQGYCVGLPEGVTCSQHGMCNPGLYCTVTDGSSSGVCKPQVPIGGDCDNFLKCTNDALCSADGICKAYFSLANGESPRNCYSYVNQECQSGTCASIGDKPDCIAAQASSDKLLLECTQGPNCHSANFTVADHSDQTL